MSTEPDIRAVLKGRLQKVSSNSDIPTNTLRRGRLRRRYAMVTAAVGGVASALLIFLGFQAIESPQPTVDQAPVSTPSREEPAPSATPQPDEDEGQEKAKEPGDLEAPPPVTVSALDKTIELPAWTYCYKNGCIDGAPPSDLAHVGSPDEVIVEFPLADWSFTAYFTPSGQKCGRSQEVPLESSGNGTFLLQPAGSADVYDVTLFGRGDGSLSVTFQWATPIDGPLPEPEARAAIVSGEEGHPVSYGVELELTNLAETPDEASATITVEAHDGDSITFEAERARQHCWPEGTVYWDGPDDKGLQAAELGDGPFEYTVELTLDGQRYVGTGTWPMDEIRGNEPSVSLDFNPDLPSLR